MCHFGVLVGVFELPIVIAMTETTSHPCHSMHGCSGRTANNVGHARCVSWRGGFRQSFLRNNLTFDGRGLIICTKESKGAMALEYYCESWISVNEREIVDTITVAVAETLLFS